MKHFDTNFVFGIVVVYVVYFIIKHILHIAYADIAIAAMFLWIKVFRSFAYIFLFMFFLFPKLPTQTLT